MKCRFVKTTNVYILWRNHILLIKRSQFDESLAGVWESPGGHVDYPIVLGDSFPTRQEALREVKEEAGLDLDLGRLQLYTIDRKNCHVAYIYDISTTSPPPVKLSFEHSHFRWTSCKSSLRLRLRKEVFNFVRKMCK